MHGQLFLPIFLLHHVRAETICRIEVKIFAILSLHGETFSPASIQKSLEKHATYGE